MRNYWRQRNDPIQSAGRHIQRMQKVLTEMNLQLANVLSDLSGVTGQAIVKAILDGEHNPYKLAELRDRRVKATKEQIARSLEGNWQDDLLFILRQEHEAYEFCEKQIDACDKELKQYLNEREDRSTGIKLDEEKRKSRRKKKRAHTPQQFDLREALFRMTGVDLTRIDGIDVITAATVISEAGWDMTKWRTENHFVSWLRLCPDNKISGEKIIGKGKLPTNNRLTSALKMAATSLSRVIRIWARNFDVCGLDSGHLSRSRPWRQSWPGWSIECFATECSTSIKERGSMRSNTVSGKSLF
jgi:transposase